MQSLEEIKVTLLAALGGEAMFSLVNTRLVLKTGIDLLSIQLEDNTSTEAVAKVISALESMGYSRANLALVSRRKTS